MIDSFKLSVKKIYTALDLSRNIVGIKLLKSKEEFDSFDLSSPKKPMNYCGMVKAAYCGNSIKARLGDFACGSGPRVLGIDKSDIKNSNGENWFKLGIYGDANLSKTIRKELSYVEEDIYGIVAQPIKNCESIPDVIIVITNPFNCMRLVQGYAYHYGMPKNINMIGNQAVCLECTARPYVTQDLNTSLLCIGTRHRAGWKPEDMAIGIPVSKFENMVDGVFRTINIMENNSNKEKIEIKLKEKKIDELKIKYNYNYYKDC